MTARSFRFEVTRGRYVAGDAPLFAGHRLRMLAQGSCEPFTIRWRDYPLTEDGNRSGDVLVVEGSGPSWIVSALQAYVMGHDWEAVVAEEERRLSERLRLPVRLDGSVPAGTFRLVS